MSSAVLNTDLNCLNWTKVGLKDPGEHQYTDQVLCLNWTKVGLKDSYKCKMVIT